MEMFKLAKNDAETTEWERKTAAVSLCKDFLLDNVYFLKSLLPEILQ